MNSYVKIQLDNSNYGTYSPGQTIVGKVECYFALETTIRAVRIKFKGRARNVWTIQKSSASEEEIYFDQEYNLFGGEEQIKISAGQYTYPFSYILPPPPLPSAFKNVYGDIKYKIKAVVDIPWKTDLEDEFLFYIISALDLNYLPAARNLKVPFSQSREEVVGSWCTDSGPIQFSVSLPFTGYAAGQNVDVATSVQNMSGVNVQKIVYKIKKRNEHLMPKHDSEREEKHTISKVISDPIGAHSEKSWTTSLHVPATEIGNVESCTLINSTYRLQVELVLPFPNRNFEISCPLIFGTVPLAGVGTNTLEPPPLCDSKQL